jgi:hypothetical protein
MTNTKEEIISSLNSSFKHAAGLVSTSDKYTFELSKNSKWSVGQHLNHLIKSVEPVNMALGLPRIIPTLLFGKRNRPVLNYDGVIARYKEVLANGGKSTGAYLPGNVLFEKRGKLVRDFNVQLNKLTVQVNKLTDEQLDNILLPHPLLGKMTIREILFFTIYHTQHHANSMELTEGN